MTAQARGLTANARHRQLVVTLGIAAALVGAGLTIRAAAQWAAAEAPLADPPISLASVQQALDQERTRSAELEAELAALATSTVELRTALEAAQAQVGTDRTTADELRASLAIAQAKLARLQAALRNAGGSSGSAAIRSGGAGGDDGGGRDDD